MIGGIDFIGIEQLGAWEKEALTTKLYNTYSFTASKTFAANKNCL